MTARPTKALLPIVNKSAARPRDLQPSFTEIYGPLFPHEPPFQLCPLDCGCLETGIRRFGFNDLIPPEQRFELPPPCLLQI
jgi:hypothetical protein